MEKRTNKKERRKKKNKTKTNIAKPTMIVLLRYDRISEMNIRRMRWRRNEMRMTKGQVEMEMSQQGKGMKRASECGMSVECEESKVGSTLVEVRGRWKGAK